MLYTTIRKLGRQSACHSLLEISFPFSSLSAHQHTKYNCLTSPSPHKPINGPLSPTVRDGFRSGERSTQESPSRALAPLSQIVTPAWCAWQVFCYSDHRHPKRYCLQHQHQSGNEPDRHASIRSPGGCMHGRFGHGLPWDPRVRVWLLEACGARQPSIAIDWCRCPGFTSLVVYKESFQRCNSPPIRASWLSFCKVASPPQLCPSEYSADTSLSFTVSNYVSASRRWDCGYLDTPGSRNKFSKVCSIHPPLLWQRIARHSQRMNPCLVARRCRSTAVAQLLQHPRCDSIQWRLWLQVHKQATRNTAMAHPPCSAFPPASKTAYLVTRQIDRAVGTL